VSTQEEGERGGICSQTKSRAKITIINQLKMEKKGKVHRLGRRRGDPRVSAKEVYTELHTRERKTSSKLGNHRGAPISLHILGKRDPRGKSRDFVLGAVLGRRVIGEAQEKDPSG